MVPTPVREPAGPQPKATAPRLVIANRGEIARRVLRSARARGFRAAVVSTPADRGAPVRREADRVLEVGDFLDREGVVTAAAGWGADLLHPGYGFLSESPAFAAAVEAAGIAFCGPTPRSMRLLGDKQEARRLAAASGVPVVRGVEARELEGGDPGRAAECAGLRFPVAVKAAAGGGGIGIRVVEDPGELPAALAAASSQAKAAFGDGTVYLERWIAWSRHLEIQVFGDGAGRGIHLGERECSVQRRRQKLLEWTPAFGMTRALRGRLGEAALRLVARSRYRGAGTVEFLLEPNGEFHFLEVNTRLQVEHPVTEAVYGLDLVDAQFELALGRWPDALPAPGGPEDFEPLVPQGAAVEARVLAESPARGFAPSPGQIRRLRLPDGVRVDSGVETGTAVPPGFDSLLLKVVASGADPAAAGRRLAAALEETVVHGVETNLSLLAAVLRHPDFTAGRIHTAWVERRIPELAAERFPAGARTVLEHPRGAVAVLEAASGRERSPGAAAFHRIGASDGGLPRIEPGPGSGDACLYAGDGGAPLRITATGPGPDGAAWFSAGGGTLRIALDAASEEGPENRGREDVRAPLAGRLLQVRNEPGRAVEGGEVVARIESMKMHWEVRAPAAGHLSEPAVPAGETVAAGQLLLTVLPAPKASAA